MRDQTRQQLRKRLDIVEEQIQAACDRARRHRDEVLLVAVTKSVSSEVAAALHDLGVEHLAESRPQELWRKAASLPKSVQWHQIGHLQTNKIDKTLPLVTLIHSLDRWRLAVELDKEAEKQGREVDVLLQINASKEEQKHGFAPEDLEEFLAQVTSLSHVRVRGLMTMAAFSEDSEQCRPAFALLRELRDQYRNQLAAPHALDDLSMGMSHDFAVAIEEGATMIRLGSTLFEDVT